MTTYPESQTTDQPEQTDTTTGNDVEGNIPHPSGANASPLVAGTAPNAPRLTKGSKSILEYLNKTSGNPTQDQIGEALKVNRSTVQRGTRQLAEAGYIRIRQGGQFEPLTYEVLSVPDPDPVIIAPPTPKASNGEAACADAWTEEGIMYAPQVPYSVLIPGHSGKQTADFVFTPTLVVEYGPLIGNRRIADEEKRSLCAEHGITYLRVQSEKYIPAVVEAVRQHLRQPMHYPTVEGWTRLGETTAARYPEFARHCQASAVALPRLEQLRAFRDRVEVRARPGTVNDGRDWTHFNRTGEIRPQGDTRRWVMVPDSAEVIAARATAEAAARATAEARAYWGDLLDDDDATPARLHAAPAAEEPQVPDDDFSTLDLSEIL